MSGKETGEEKSERGREREREKTLLNKIHFPVVRV